MDNLCVKKTFKGLTIQNIALNCFMNLTFDFPLMFVVVTQIWSTLRKSAQSRPDTSKSLDMNAVYAEARAAKALKISIVDDAASENQHVVDAPLPSQDKAKKRNSLSAMILSMEHGKYLHKQEPVAGANVEGATIDANNAATETSFSAAGGVTATDSANGENAGGNGEDHVSDLSF